MIKTQIYTRCVYIYTISFCFFFFYTCCSKILQTINSWLIHFNLYIFYIIFDMIIIAAFPKVWVMTTEHLWSRPTRVVVASQNWVGLETIRYRIWPDIRIHWPFYVVTTKRGVQEFVFFCWMGRGQVNFGNHCDVVFFCIRVLLSLAKI